MLRTMLAKSILALAALVSASVSRPSEESAPDRGRLFFTCTGLMRAAGAPATPIVAEAFIDLEGRRVDGFGVRSACLLYTSPSPRDS